MLHVVQFRDAVFGIRERAVVLLTLKGLGAHKLVGALNQRDGKMRENQKIKYIGHIA